MMTILGILGGLGGVGAIAVYLMGGAKILGIIKGIVDFFKTPGGQKVAMGLLALAVAIGLFQTGRNYERNKCDAEELREQLAAERAAHNETKRQVKVGDDIQKRDVDRAADDHPALEKNEQNVQSTPANKRPCLDADALKRVYDIR